MKRIAVAILLLSSYCYAQTTNGFAPASTNVWGAEYPRVDASGRAEFRVKAPNATAVKLNFWSNPKLGMVKGSDGFWLVKADLIVNYGVTGDCLSSRGEERSLGELLHILRCSTLAERWGRQTGDTAAEARGEK